MQRGAILRPLLKGAAGFLLGFAIWAGLTEPYNRFLALASETVLHATEDPNRTDLRPQRREIVIYRSDVPPGSTRPGIPAYDLTFNVVLLAVLFAVNREVLSSGNVGRFALALLLLVPTHVFGVLAWVLDLYASQFGPLSEKLFSDFERSLWKNLVIFYRLVGQFAFPLILWWSLTPEKSPAAASEPRPKRRRRS